MGSTSSFIRALLASVTAVLALMVSCHVFADTEGGYSWLTAQQNAGAFKSNATSMEGQATSEAFLALMGQGSASFDRAGAVDSLAAAQEGAIESLCRQIVAEKLAGRNFQANLSILLASQNMDGGFGSYVDYESTPIDTAYALYAMAQAGATLDKITNALSYLLRNQNSDGSFSNGKTLAGSSFYVTSVALIAMQSQRFNFSMSSQLNKSADYLLDQMVNNSAKLSYWEKSLGLLAIRSVVTDSTKYQSIYNALLAAQNANGSWANDAYITALVLQALAISPLNPDEPPSELDEGVIKGVVVDAISGNPIVGTTVVLSGDVGGTLVTDATGQFNFSNLPKAEYALSVSVATYSPQEISITIGEPPTVNLGEVVLSKLPLNEAVIRGYVKDAGTNAPIIGANLQFTGAISTSIQTDINGYYQINGSPGDFSVIVSADGFYTINAAGKMGAGALVNFSPSLTKQTSDPTPPELPTTASIQGRVLDAATNTPLVGAKILEQSSGLSAFTNALGQFKLEGLGSGQLIFIISSSGYQDVSAEAVVPNGALIAAGDIYLSPIQTEEPPVRKSILQGRILTADTLEPIPGASVWIKENGLNTKTDASGNYSITGIAELSFTVNIAATGFRLLEAPVTVDTASIITANYQLLSANDSGIEIIELEAETGLTSRAGDEIELEVELLNSSVKTKSVQLYVNMVNESGIIVKQFPAVMVPMGADPEMAFITLNPSEEAETEIEWMVGSTPPGKYEIVVQAVDHNQRLMAERSIVVDILPTKKIGGMISLDPPVMQLAENRPVNIKAKVGNRGNVDIAEASVTTKVTLKNKGTALKSKVELSIYDDTNFTHATYADTDAAGNLFIVDPNIKALKKISPDGSVQTINSNLPNSVRGLIVDVDDTGLFYLLTFDSYYTLSTNNELKRYTLTGRSSFTSFALNSDKKLFIANATQIFEVGANGSSRVVVDTGVANASGFVMDSQGVIFIADESANAIWKFKDGALTSYITGLDKPTAIVIDEHDYLYLTLFGSNSLIEISPAKLQRVITNQLFGPKDVKRINSNQFLVANYGSNEVVSVTNDGQITVLVKPSINAPVTAEIGEDGKVYAVNSDGSLVSINEDLTTSNIVTGIANAKSVYQESGKFTVLHNHGVTLSEIDSSGNVRALTTSLSGSRTTIAPDGVGGVLVGGPTGIVNVSALGAITNYVDINFSTSIKTAKAANGNFYILSSQSIYEVNPETNHIEYKVRNLGFNVAQYTGVLAAGDGSLYVTDFAGRKLIRVNPDNTISTIINFSFNPSVISYGPDASILIAKYASKEIHQLKNGVVSLFKTVSLDNIYYGLQYNPNTNEIWYSSTTKLININADGLERLVTLPSGTSVSDAGLLGDGTLLVAGTGMVGKVSGSLLYSDVIAPSVSRGLIFYGVLADEQGFYWALKNQGILFKINESGAVIKKYSSVSNITDLARMQDELYAAANGNILHIKDKDALAEVVYFNGNISKINVESPTTLLAFNNSTVMRFNKDSQLLTNLSTGLVDVTEVLPLSDGRRAVLSASMNSYTEFAQSGSISRTFTGLVQPLAVDMDSQGVLFIGESKRGAILKQVQNSFLQEWYLSGQVTNIRFVPNGNLQVIVGSMSREITPTKQAVNTLSFTRAVDLLTGNDGKKYALAQSQLNSVVGSELTPIASGLSNIKDIDFDKDDNLFAIDGSQNGLLQIEQDGTTLFKEYYSSPYSLDIEKTKNIFAVTTSVGGYSIFDTNGNRLEDKTPATHTNVLVRVFDGPNKGYWLKSNIVYKADITLGGEYGIQPGDVVYSVTTPITSLMVDTVPMEVNLGSWHPEEDGDYIVELISDLPDVEGSLTNVIHIGPLAKSEFTLASSEVLPGNARVGSTLNTVGAATNTITRIDTAGLTLSAISGTTGRGVAADSFGNLYALTPSTTGGGKIVKINSLGQVSTFVDGVPNMATQSGMVIDNDNNLYVPSNGNDVIRIKPDKTYSNFVTFPSNINTVNASFDGEIFVIIREGIYKVNPDGSTTKLKTPMDGRFTVYQSAIDPDGNFYVENSNYDILKISADGKSISTFHTTARFEHEGQNLISDCSGNIIFAPFQQPPFMPTLSEERFLVQVMRDTGEMNVVLEGPTLDPALGDMDVAYYDRFSNRIVLWTDHNSGKIFSLPVICGGIDTEVHATTRPDVELASVYPAPSSVIENPDGTKQYVWSLKNVDIKGFAIEGTWLYSGLAEGEVRPVVADAYLQFNNSFNTGNPVTVPIAIPSVIATTKAVIAPTTDKLVYGANENVGITVNVINSNVLSFDGSVGLEIVAESGEVVEELNSIPINQLVSGSNTNAYADWNTATTYIGKYFVKASLYDVNGIRVSQGETQFDIGVDSEIARVVDTQIASDKIVYLSASKAFLEGVVRNVSKNDILTDTIALISIKAPDESVVFSQEFAVNSLYPNGIERLHSQFDFEGAALGEYVLELTLRDAENHMVVSSSEYKFTVIETGLNSTGLIGSVTVDRSQVPKGDNVVCTEHILNKGSVSFPSLPLRQLLIGIEPETQISELPFEMDIPAGESEEVSNTISTSNLSLGGYACVLQVLLNGQWETLAAAGFSVTAPSIDVSSTLRTDKAEYDLLETVIFSMQIQNNKNAAVNEPLIAKLVVKNAGGEQVHLHSFNIPSLDAGAAPTYAANLPLTTMEAGAYLAELTVYGDDGARLLTSASAEFVVSINPLNYLTGNVNAAHAELEKGLPQVCRFDITNSGTVDVNGLMVKKSVIDLASNLSIQDKVDTVSVPSASTAGEDVTFATQGMDVGNYACSLSVTVAGKTRVLASAEFRVIDSPIKVEGDIKLGDKANLLVLVDVAPAGAYGEILYVKSLLDNAGWHYTMVDSAKDFDRELITGNYGAYALLSERITLTPKTREKLKAEVALGDGLLVSNGHDRRHQSLEDALGIRVHSKKTHIAGIDAQQSPVGESWSHTFTNTFNSMTFDLAGATAFGYFVLASPQNTAAEKPLGMASDFNVFILDNYTSLSSTVEGRMAVGGNLNLNNFSVGDKLNPAKRGDVVVVGGDVTFPSGRIYNGNLRAGGSVAGVGSAVRNGMAKGAVIAGNAYLPVEFGNESAYLQELSTNLAALPATGTVTLQWGGYALKGDCTSKLQVFNVNAAELATVHTYAVSCIPNGATVIFNILGEAATIQNMGMQSLTAIRDKVLFNFPQAKTVKLTSVAIEGSILAPYAEFAQPAGRVEGQVIAKSWLSTTSGYMSIHNRVFSGDVSAAWASTANNALAYFQYQQGKTLFAGFDVADHAYTLSKSLTANQQNHFANLLLNGLLHINPDETLTRAGKVVPVVITMANTATKQAVGQATLSLSENLSIKVPDGFTQIPNTFTWSVGFSLAPEAQQQKTIYVQLPNTTGASERIALLLQTGIAPDIVTQAEKTLDIPIR